MRVRACFIIVVLLALSAPSPPALATTPPTGFEEQVLTSGTLGGPTAVAFAPDGRKFVAQKSGLVRVVLANGTVRSTALLDLRAKVNSYSDRGLLGIATDKDFTVNGYLYLLYVYELLPATPDTDAPMVSRLTRVTVKADNTVENPSDPETVILGKDVSAPCPMPDNTRDCIPADYKWHVIGTVRVDPVDGTLWLGNGDTHAPVVDSQSYRPYDEHSLAGKIIHIDQEGRGLPNHPFCPEDTDLTHTCTKIYAKGFRNPFRFTLRPGKGPVVGDVGNAHQEELDLVRPGQNYGWPCYEGTIRTPMYDQEARCKQEYAKEGTAEAAAAPAWSYPRGSGAAIVAGPMYTGTQYPHEYRGDIFVGDYVQRWIKRLDVDADDRVTGVTDFALDWPTGVDLQAMPDTGDLAYVDLGYGGGVAAVRRFVYTGSVNGPPAARVSATPTSGMAPLHVQFRGADSSDPDGDALTYDWAFGDGTPNSSDVNPSHTYATDGDYTATLTVSDGHGNRDSATIRMTVGNSAPTVTIVSPGNESLYRNGEAVVLEGSAADAEDGALADAGYQWEVRLHHATHVHEFSTPSGASANLVPTRDHDADSYYEIRLTVTDSGGLQTTKAINIRPQTSRLTLASSPPGAPIGYADQNDEPAPFTKVAAVGFIAPVAAAESFVRDGTTYEFAGWSDGGAAQHPITVPAVDTTLTATYSSVGSSSVTLHPEADAQVREASPTTNYATWRLRVDGGADPDVDSYLRFTIPSSDRSISRAVLRLYATSGTVNGPAVYTTGTDWTEAGITWANRPARTSDATDKKGVIAANSWVEFDVTALVRSFGTHNFVLATISSDGADFNSREAAADKPQLVVTLSDSAPPPPPPPPPPPADTTAPTAVTVTAKAATGPRVDLSWTAATDDVGVTRYEVHRRLRGGLSWTMIATRDTTVRSYTDSAVSPSTTYDYQVRAFDAAENSASSAVVSVKTRRS